MKKQIFIINGGARCGKDTFVRFVSEILDKKQERSGTVMNVSSIDKVKEIAAMAGYSEERKDENDRWLLSTLKDIFTRYNNLPFRDMEAKVARFKKKQGVWLLFLHIREPENIEIAKNTFGAKTVFLINDHVPEIISNPSDKNVANYEYDYQINNNGTETDLKKEAERFVEKIL